uniref:Uncharacterized protein n=1 Tax=Gasterosteus aculeatus TaxID=69293 RepID=G3PYQ7_GASAC
DESPSRGVLALKPPPYVTDQSRPGPLGVQVGVELSHLAGAPQPLPGHEAAVVREYGEQTLPLSDGSRGLTGTRTCPLEPGEQQARASAQQRHPPDRFSAFLDGPPQRPAALELRGFDTNPANGTTGHGVKHGDAGPSSPGKNKDKYQQSDSRSVGLASSGAKANDSWACTTHYRLHS